MQRLERVLFGFDGRVQGLEEEWELNGMLFKASLNALSDSVVSNSFNDDDFEDIDESHNPDGTTHRTDAEEIEGQDLHGNATSPSIDRGTSEPWHLDSTSCEMSCMALSCMQWSHGPSLSPGQLPFGSSAPPVAEIAPKPATSEKVTKKRASKPKGRSASPTPQKRVRKG